MSKNIKVVYTTSEGVLHQEDYSARSTSLCAPRKNEVVHLNGVEYYVRRVVHEPLFQGVDGENCQQTYHRIVVELMQ
ncbi:hypothetical protein [Pectobacterium phage Wc4-1]|uniref:Uncharacterized protein n=1 Tax=Pectobacterium phage Wc4 TaxID=2652428 RepID=A0A5P8D496_9CAUD|nr:hypothetical protein [Pectobacterium phage Wc4]QFP93990.1 hypothetical protein [Pectobacterium phage Wc4-1]